MSRGGVDSPMHTMRLNVYCILLSCCFNSCNDEETLCSWPSSHLGLFKYSSIFTLAASLLLYLLNMVILPTIATAVLHHTSTDGEFDNFFVFSSISSNNFDFNRRRSSITGRVSTWLNLLSDSVLNAIDDILSDHSGGT